MPVDIMSSNVNTIERIMERLFRIEYGTVVKDDQFGIIGVQCREDPGSTLWNTVTVRIRSTKTRMSKTNNKGEAGDPYKVMHYYCTVLQGYSQKWAGHPYTPRIGDMVAVLFIFNQKPLVLGTVYTNTQDPVCRAPFDKKSWAKIDARYDDVDKWCQWERPTFNENQEVTEHQPGKNPICKKRFHRSRDQIHTTQCREGNKDPCHTCDELDHIKRVSNQWEKIYSDVTKSIDPEHPYLPSSRIHTLRRHEWHEPSGSYMVLQNSPAGDDDFGKGLIRIENAQGECDIKGHINMRPTGTIDVHGKYNGKEVGVPSENTGARMMVVANDDGDFSEAYEAIYFEKDAYIRIMKDGQIIIRTPYKITVESTGDEVHVKAATKITLEAPLIDEITDLVHNYGEQQIDEFCTHDGCSCP